MTHHLNDTINDILQVERLCNKNNKKIEKNIRKSRPTNLCIVEISILKLCNSEAVETNRVFLI